MIRNLKALGLALVAVFAMSAMAAQAASAQDLFTSPGATTILTGESEEPGQFLSRPTNGAVVECEHSFYTATASGTAVSSITVHPEYPDETPGECEAVGIGTAEVSTEGCDYVLTGETDGTSDATVNLECTTGHEIEVVVPGICTLKFGTQTNLSGVHYTSSGGDVTVKATVTHVHYTKVGSFCGLVPGNGTEGVLNENVTVKGYEDNGTTQDSTTHEYTQVNEGSPVSISVS